MKTPVVLVTGFLGSGKTTLIDTALKAPELARTVVVVNEFGVTEGVVTIADLFQTMAGNMMPGANDPALALAAQREDGSWLLDGLLPVDEMQDKLGLAGLADETQGLYHTVGGFVNQGEPMMLIVPPMRTARSDCDKVEAPPISTTRSTPRPPVACRTACPHLGFST